MFAIERRSPTQPKKLSPNEPKHWTLAFSLSVPSDEYPAILGVFHCRVSRGFDHTRWPPKPKENGQLSMCAPVAKNRWTDDRGSLAVLQYHSGGLSAASDSPRVAIVLPRHPY